MLREVLRLRAAEVAELLDTSVAAVSSRLQRSRAQLEAAELSLGDRTEPDDPRQRELLDRYARAIEAMVVAAIVAVFTADVVWEMPPFSAWFRGPDAIARLIATHCPAKAGEIRLLPTE